jgi:hypothetical protein
MIKVTDEMREAARRILSKQEKEPRWSVDLLNAIADGKRKLIDAHWWKKIHGDVDQAKLDKIAAMTDPERNSNEHERAAAASKLASAKATRPPGLPPEPPPLPTDAAGWVRKRKTKRASAPQQAALSDSVSIPPPRLLNGHDSVLNDLNERRAEKRAAKRANLKCQSCGNPLAARRTTARYCNATCRSRSWRSAPSSPA